MMNLFVEGGWGMFPVLVFGLVLVVSAGRYAWEPAAARLRFIVAMSVLLATAIAHAMLTNVAAVFSFVSNPESVSDTQLARVLCTGFMESTRPGALGGAFLVLALVLVAVGVYRDGRKELRLAA